MALGSKSWFVALCTFWSPDPNHGFSISATTSMGSDPSRGFWSSVAAPLNSDPGIQVAVFGALWQPHWAHIQVVIFGDLWHHHWAWSKSGLLELCDDVIELGDNITGFGSRSCFLDSVRASLSSDPNRGVWTPRGNIIELGSGSWFLDLCNNITKLGYKSWLFELCDSIIELGSRSWFLELCDKMLESNTLMIRWIWSRDIFGGVGLCLQN